MAVGAVEDTTFSSPAAATARFTRRVNRCGVSQVSGLFCGEEEAKGDENKGPSPPPPDNPKLFVSPSSSSNWSRILLLSPKGREKAPPKRGCGAMTRLLSPQIGRRRVFQAVLYFLKDLCM